MVYAALMSVILLSQQEPLVTKGDFPKYMETAGLTRAKAEWLPKVADAKRKADLAKKARIFKNAPGGDGEFSGLSIPTSFKSAEEKRQYVEAAEAAVKEAIEKSKAPQLPMLAAHRMRVGDVGTLYCPIPINNPDSGKAFSMLVTQPLGGGRFMVHMGEKRGFEATFVINTSEVGVVAGSQISTRDKCYEVVGTTSVDGSTVFDVVPFDWRTYLREHKRP